MRDMRKKVSQRILGSIATLVVVCAIVYSEEAKDQFGYLLPPPVHREATVYWTATAPKIDGDLSDEIWQSLPRATGMTNITFRHDYVTNQAFLVLCYDDENIYIGIDCRDRFPERVKATVTERDSGMLFSNDTAEIFFDPDGTGKYLKQLAVNPLGTQFDVDLSDSKYILDWNGEWRSRGKRTPYGWSVEMAVPFATLGMPKPKPCDKWRGNYARTRPMADMDVYSSWSVVTNGFNSPREFGYWVFAEPGKILNRDNEMTINGEFVQDAYRRLNDTLRQAKDEIALMERIPASLRPAWIVERHKGIETKIDKLNVQLAKIDTGFDNLLEARQIGTELSKEIEDIDVLLSHWGLAGPVSLPIRSEPGIWQEGHYWLLTTTNAIFALDAETGCVAGIWELPSQRRLVSASYDLYTLETMSITEHSDERIDRVTKIHREGSGLKFTCINPHLLGVTITKEYLLESNGRVLTKRVSVSAWVKEKTLFTSSSNTVFDEGYRKPSYYNRVIPASCTGGSDPRPTIPAIDITDPIIQRSANNMASGWSQFLLINPEAGSGMAQYLYKINGEYVWIPGSVNSSYWNSYGWEMSFMATFLNSAPFTSEMRYHLFSGDQLSFYKEYLALPEVTSARDDIKVHPVIYRMRYEGQGDGLMYALRDDFPDKFPRFTVPHSRLRSDEVILQGACLPYHSRFSHWPSNDEDFFIANVPPPSGQEQRTAADEVKKALSRMREFFPRSPIGANYWVHTDIHPETELYKKHPEFTIVGKDGKPLPSCHPYGAYESDMSEAFTLSAVKGYARMLDYLNLNYIYFDNIGTLTAPDWGEGKVVQATDYIYFLKSVRAMLEERGGFLFLNGDTGHLYVDISFAEVMNSIEHLEKYIGKEWWRPLGERLMQYKFFERDGSATILLFWTDYRKGPQAKGDNTGREYTNLILSLGMRPHNCYYDYSEELKREEGTIDNSAVFNYEEAYQQATMEMQETRLVDPDLKPAYWRDFETKIESYVLRLGKGFFFTANNHYPEIRDIILTADIEKMGISPEHRTFFWNYTRRDDMKVNRLDGPGLNGPGKPGWDRLFINVECQSSILPGSDNRLHIEMPNLEPTLTRVATVTQVPGVIYSVEDQHTQFLIPKTLGCEVEGELNEARRTNTLRVNADKPCQILAWWPEGWGDTNVNIAESVSERVIKQDEVGKIRYGAEQFLVINLPKGVTNVELTAK